MAEKTSYLGAFLRHPHNRVALLAAGVVAVFASIPLGWSGLALVGVLGLGLETLAALVVPSLPGFRSAVDRSQRQQSRAQRRLQWLSELSNQGDSNALATYQHMLGRVQSLYQTAGEHHTTLTRADVEKLEDLTVDYLGLCVLSLSLKQRKDQATQEQIVKRIASVQAQLQNTTLPEDETRQLRATLAEYDEAMKRARRLAVRRSALEASLLALPDKMEEVYQLVITSPYASDMGSQLEDSLQRLRLAEEVAAEFDTPSGLDLPGSTLAARANKAAASSLKA